MTPGPRTVRTTRSTGCRVALIASLAAGAVGLAGAVCPAAARAQSTVPEEIRERLDALGYENPYAVADSIYVPLLSLAPKGGVEVTKDIAYGPHPRHLLDIYRPDGVDGAGLPVFVYVHGGGYRIGDRDINDEMYANVLYYFARQGMLGINATYRLAPEAEWPSGGEDMRELVAWVKENAAAHGGDPDRIFMMGHSAGATHVATYGFNDRFHQPDGHGLSGIILVSGRYVIEDRPGDPSFDGIRLYFGHDPAGYAERSVVTHVPGTDVPAMLVVAEYDQTNLATTGRLFAALCRRDGGRCPRFLQLRHHNHMSEISHINTSDDLLGREVMDFIRVGADREARDAALHVIRGGTGSPRR